VREQGRLAWVRLGYLKYILHVPYCTDDIKVRLGYILHLCLTHVPYFQDDIKVKLGYILHLCLTHVLYFPDHRCTQGG
jgi:hypothetical protein